MLTQNEIDKIENWLTQHRITEVECTITDMAGSIRGKIVPRSKYRASQGLRIPEAILTMTVTGEFVDSNAVSETDQDILLLPDVESLRIVPWAKEPTAQIMHRCLHMDGKVMPLSPRNVLQQVLDAYDALGWQALIAPEIEFYLVAMQPDEDIPLTPPIGRSGRSEAGRQSYSIESTDEYNTIFDSLYNWSEAQGIELDTLIHEVGAAQMEINLDYGNPNELADQVVLFKRTARECAIRNGMYATFMAKPMQHEPGSAMHLHQNFVQSSDGSNVFANPDGSPSQAFYHYIGGLQKYLPNAMLFFAPYINSYRRLSRYTNAPINLSWGIDNRTCGIRVPQSSAQSRRVENRLAGADANPYLAMAASLACGLVGVEERIDPSEPTQGSAYEQVRKLPKNVDEAVDALRKCQPLKRIMGEAFVETYAQVKEAEYREYFEVISPWERRYLLLTI